MKTFTFLLLFIPNITLANIIEFQLQGSTTKILPGHPSGPDFLANLFFDDTSEKLLKIDLLSDIYTGELTDVGWWENNDHVGIPYAFNFWGKKDGELLFSYFCDYWNDFSGSPLKVFGHTFSWDGALHSPGSELEYSFQAPMVLINTVPEPASIYLLFIGLLAGGYWKIRSVRFD